MRFLVVSAGALGGYFGGRLLAARRDVTFLLRPRRAAQLERTGLVVRSAMGDLHLAAPPHVLSGDIAAPYDVVIVGCKAYDLAETMESFAAAVGPQTVILPLLNGMGHLEQLAARFGHNKVLGGLCMISATLDNEGSVLHMGEMHGLTFGELDGSASARVAAVHRLVGGPHQPHARVRWRHRPGRRPGNGPGAFCRIQRHRRAPWFCATSADGGAGANHPD